MQRKRIAYIVGGALGGMALVGVGVAVGTQVGQQQAVMAAADAEGPLTKQDRLLLTSFTRASENFDILVTQAQKGKQVGPQMTRQAVAVLNVKRLAVAPELRDTAGTTAQAMLLIGAGITTNDTGTVQEGIDAYKDAQQDVIDLVKLVNPDAEIPESVPSTEPSPAGEPAEGD